MLLIDYLKHILPMMMQSSFSEPTRSPNEFFPNRRLGWCTTVMPNPVKHIAIVIIATVPHMRSDLDLIVN